MVEQVGAQLPPESKLEVAPPGKLATLKLTFCVTPESKVFVMRVVLEAAVAVGKELQGNVISTDLVMR